MITRPIPSTNEQLPVIGMGTWQTFDVGAERYPLLNDVLSVFHQEGAKLIDSSPMYGRSEQAVGDITGGLSFVNDLFYATKVWTTGESEGIAQMETSMQKMGRKTLDLIQIHNLVDWKTHLKTLRRWKDEGKVRYIGITHYVDDAHEELEKVLRAEQLDFVQFNYSILSRNAEKSLLPAAAERGVATLINEPFEKGKLFAKVAGLPLPSWAAESGMVTWSDFFLKYILAHEAVTCLIPATGNPLHMKDNCMAGMGSLPDESMCKKMIDFIRVL